MTIEEVERFAIERLRALEIAIAAVPDPRDMPTPREQEEVATRKDGLWKHWRITANAKDDVRDLIPKVEAVANWCDVLITTRQSVCEELLTIVEPGRSLRAQALKMALSNIDRGCELFGNMMMLAAPLADALYAAGYAHPRDGHSVWDAGFGCLPNAQRHLEMLQQRLAAAQGALDRELATPV
jgi:hypothetical protein